jgi:hypothetical protein
MKEILPWTNWFAVCILILLATMFSGCDRTESDWEQAKGANTIPAYKEFLSKHSEVPRGDQAKAAIQTETDWDQAKATNTIQSYKEFLSKHSEGPHADVTGRLKTGHLRALQNRPLQGALFISGFLMLARFFSVS